MNKIVAIENRLSNPPDVRKLQKYSPAIFIYIAICTMILIFTNRIWWHLIASLFERLVLHE